MISPHFFDIFVAGFHSWKFLQTFEFPCAGAGGEERSAGPRLGDQLLVQLPQVDLHWSVQLSFG